jgi:hypothetical protein
MNIYEKLMAVQSELKAPKGQYNSFGKYAYRSCEDILESVKPLLAAQKMTLTVHDDIVLIGERYYIKATAVITDVETAETVQNTAFAREEDAKKGMDASQVTGAASSYARKYALNGLFCIDDNKDADTDENRRQQENAPDNRRGTGNASGNNQRGAWNTSGSGRTTQRPEAPPPKLAENYVNSLFMEMQRTGIDQKVILANYKVKDIHDMTLDQYKHCMRRFQNTPDKSLPELDPGTVPPDNSDGGLPWNVPQR